MNIREWLPIYSGICQELSINPADDFLSSVRLSAILDQRPPKIPQELMGKEVSIFGPALKKYEELKSNELTVVADSGIGAFLSIYRRNPDIIVTDLDGDISMIKRCSAEGTLLFVHSHGDNMGAIHDVVPTIEGNIIGTTQNFPLHNIRNYFGFTDGDRSVFIAMALKACSITIHGFDFASPAVKESTRMDRKKEKLKIAERLVSIADSEMRSAGLPGISFSGNNIGR
ncbi:MAG: DUF115 domain-containing protein [Candidatus Thermoplasmatota archaeon]|nr:DUF115 domain-containing protein [Candidatus Thermoplasmatota archaeon]